MSNLAFSSRETCVESHLFGARISTVSQPRPAAIVPYKSKNRERVTNKSGFSKSVSLKLHKNLNWLKKWKRLKSPRQLESL